MYWHICLSSKNNLLIFFILSREYPNFSLNFISMRKLVLITATLFLASYLNGQVISESSSLLATFGNMSDISCGDDDFSQTIFFAIPEKYKGNVFLRVFDPDCGGELDLCEGLWETNTLFEVFGGKDCLSGVDARSADPEGNYKSGTMLQRELFARESEIDGDWFSFGPFSTKQGESISEYPGYVFFKLIVEGRTGNDGNVYGVLVSSSRSSNIAIPKSRVFDYESTYLEENAIRTTHVVADRLSNNKVPIPLTLEPIQTVPDYSIIAIPLDE